MQFSADTFYISTSDTLLGGELLTNACYTNAKTHTTFFTNGKRLFNNYYQLVENGDRLVYDSLVELYYTEPDGLPIVQGAIFIPTPNSNNKCYLFQQTLDAPLWTDSTNGYWLSNKIYFQIIDMNANNNHGSIIKKNRILYSNDTLVTGLTAVKAANGTDYWLFAHGFNSDIYYRWLITETSIEGPFIQHIGFKADAVLSLQYNGSAVFSNDGTHFALAGKLVNEVELYDFDRCSGVLSNRRMDSIPETEILPVYSACFSSDGKNLFVNSPEQLYEYKVNDIDFQKSRVFIAKADNYGEGGVQGGFGTLMLAPNNNIYLSTYNGQHRLHRIKYPNNYGISCNFQQHFDTIPGEASTLPNIPNYHLIGLPVYMAMAGNDTTIHPRDTISIGSSLNNPAFIYQWSPYTGLDNPASFNPRCYPKITTTYKLTVTDIGATYSCNTITDSIKVTIDSLNGAVTLNPFKALMYPNPASNDLNIKFNQRLNSNYTIEVYNSVGQQMNNISLAKRDYKATINSSNLQNGFYFLRIVQNGNAIFKSTFEVMRP